jgi:transcriptional regulator with XRE-family HTH domain
VAEDAMPWEEAVTRRIAVGVTRARKARGWNVQRLSDECGKRAGVGVSRGTIAKLESGERKVISVPEWLALSYTLDVPPITLLFPFEEAASFSVVPGSPEKSSVDAWAWLTGEARQPPGETVDDRAQWDRAAAVLRLLNRTAAVLGEAHGMLEDDARGMFELRREESGEPVARYLERLPDLQRAWAHIVRQFDVLQRQFEANGWAGPPIPAEVRHAVEERLEQVVRLRQAEGRGNAEVVE